jgi:hypothetical protein
VDFVIGIVERLGALEHGKRDRIDHRHRHRPLRGADAFKRRPLLRQPGDSA